ncbi:MAG: prophage tail fiber N-terminal domain-containing protein [Shewanella sp.]
MIKLFGVMTDPAGLPVPNALLEFRAINSTKEALFGGVVTYKCDAAGRYDLNLALGHYDVYAQSDYCSDMDYLGTAAVTEETEDGDIYHILVDGGMDITPPIVAIVINEADRAEAAAKSAEENAALASDSAAAAGSSADSVSGAVEAAQSASEEAQASAELAADAVDSTSQNAERAEKAAGSAASSRNEVKIMTQAVWENAAAVAADTETVAQLADVVGGQAAQVAEDAQQVAIDLVQVSELTNLAGQAADTASQKAKDAAASEAAAEEAAERAEAAALVNTGAVLDGGTCDLSGGAYPTPIMISGEPHSTVWYVAIAGTVDTEIFEEGDQLRYTTAEGGKYFKVDAKDSVYSVNGEKGPVTVTPEKIGAEKAGVAADLVQQHDDSPNAHDVLFAQKLGVDAYLPRAGALMGTEIPPSNPDGNKVDMNEFLPGHMGYYGSDDAAHCPGKYYKIRFYTETRAIDQSASSVTFLQTAQPVDITDSTYATAYRLGKKVGDAAATFSAWVYRYDSANSVTYKDISAAYVSSNFNAYHGKQRIATNTNRPSSEGVWAIDNCAWAPEPYGMMMIFINGQADYAGGHLLGHDLTQVAIFLARDSGKLYTGSLPINAGLDAWVWGEGFSGASMAARTTKDGNNRYIEALECLSLAQAEHAMGDLSDDELAAAVAYVKAIKAKQTDIKRPMFFSRYQ